MRTCFCYMDSHLRDLDDGTDNKIPRSALYLDIGMLV